MDLEWKSAMKRACCLFLLVAWFAIPLTGQPVADKKSPPKSLAPSKNYQKVVLTRRKDNGAYRTSAYSFRHQTQELGLHRNNVDLVFNGCGQLHINPHAGLQGGIADLGEGDLEKVKLADAKKIPKQSWCRFGLLPKDGHVYIHEGRYLNQQFNVAFKVKVVTPDKLGLEWRFRGEQQDEDTEYRYAGAGTMGQCGGAHQER